MPYVMTYIQYGGSLRSLNCHVVKWRDFKITQLQSTELLDDLDIFPYPR